MRTYIHHAMTTLLDCGVSVIPICPDGSKAPLVYWTPYQQRLANQEEVAHWCRWFRHLDCGLAVVAGHGSGNVEVLDFDSLDVVEPWTAVVQEIHPGLVDQLVAVQTPRPGMSFWYRCATIAGNKKLAQNGDVTLIETRGRGGYAIIPPTPGACHPTGRPYTISHGTLRAIPEISVEQREILWNAARLFHTGPPIPEHQPALRREPAPATGDRPGDLFAAAVSWGGILEPYGWTCEGDKGEVQWWTRPGKMKGVSAISGGEKHDLLYVFSTNAPPFAAEVSYTKFAAYSWLAHGGDFGRATRALNLLGYRRSRLTATR